MVKRSTKLKRLSLLTGLAVVTLAIIEIWVPEEHLWGIVHYPLHHLAALVGGASLVGILFDLWVRREMVEEVKKAFLDDPDVSKLFADTERQQWVRNILGAQMPSDRTLSDAIFTQVVRPFMANRRFRPALDYVIEFTEPPVEGWRFAGLQEHPNEYVRLNIDNSFSQHLPKPLDEANVSVIVESLFEELQTAFDDGYCIYREALVLHDADCLAVKNQLEAVHGTSKPKDLADISAELWIDGTPTPYTRTDFVKERGRLRLWFPLPARTDFRLRVRVRAPYLLRAGHYPVIYGEPTAAPHVTFRPGPCAKPAQVHVVRVVQGVDQPAPAIATNATEVDVTFPGTEPTKRWVLPQSAIVFLWWSLQRTDGEAATLGDGRMRTSGRPTQRPSAQPAKATSKGG